MTTSEFENYFYFSEGIGRDKFMEPCRMQYFCFGTQIYNKTVTKVDFCNSPSKVVSDEAAENFSKKYKNAIFPRVLSTLQLAPLPPLKNAPSALESLPYVIPSLRYIYAWTLLVFSVLLPCYFNFPLI